jgi:hypothetical protein
MNTKVNNIHAANCPLTVVIYESDCLTAISLDGNFVSVGITDGIVTATITPTAANGAVAK